MGMSAGQARLLSITTRLTNNEFRSQTITNSKLRLADDSTEACNDYMDALNSKKLIFKTYDGDGAQTYTSLTANSILTFADLKNQYSLVNSAGKILLNGSDIKNYLASETLEEFLDIYGVQKTDNPQWPVSMKELYGSLYYDHVNSVADHDNMVAGINDVNVYINGNEEEPAVNIENLTTQADYDDFKGDIATLIANNKLPRTDGASVYRNTYDIINNAPTFVEDPGEFTMKKPDEIPNYGTLVTNYNNSQCYSSVNNTYTGDLARIGHMEHNLAALIWSVDGLGNNDNTAITNSDGSITVDREVSIEQSGERTQYVSLTWYKFQDTPSSKALLDGLNNCDYQCVQDMKQEIINLYCDVINYLVNNSGVSSTSITTKLNPERYNITSSSSCKTPEQLFSAWQSMYVSLSNLGTIAQSEYDAKLAEYNRAKSEHEAKEDLRGQFEEEFEAWQGTVQDYVDYYNSIEVPEPMMPDKTDSKYQWYVNLWHRMGAGQNDANGQRSSANYEELDPNLLNNSEWLEFALEHGVITLEQAQFSENGSAKYPEMGQYDWTSIIYTNASDIVAQDDEVAIAVAEAKYKRRMTEIENKDKQYDQDLKRLEAEHTALQTEYESVKGVIQKNVERSFKAFS